jgi:preprotein translocase subunit SecY
MFSRLGNSTRQTKLRWAVYFGLFLVIGYRLGVYIPLPGIDEVAMKQAQGSQSATMPS